MLLSHLIGSLKGKLIGERNYRRFDNRFPLLIKFIDARQDLSIQVHPDDETALRHGMANGKNEMWYLLDSEPYASLRCGMKEELSADDIIKKVYDGTICDSIAQYNVKVGVCFYIPAGRVHSIGAGCLIAEIQQTSDTTYPTFDLVGRSDGTYAKAPETRHKYLIGRDRITERFHTWLDGKNEDGGFYLITGYRIYYLILVVKIINFRRKES